MTLEIVLSRRRILQSAPVAGGENEKRVAELHQTLRVGWRLERDG
jgi:hypothetical protein